MAAKSNRMVSCQGPTKKWGDGNMLLFQDDTDELHSEELVYCIGDYMIILAILRRIIIYMSPNASTILLKIIIFMIFFAFIIYMYI